MMRSGQRALGSYPTSTTSAAVAIQNVTPRTATHTAASNGRSRSAGISWLTPKAIAGQRTASHQVNPSDPAYPSQRSASTDPGASSPDVQAHPTSRPTIAETTTVATMTAIATARTGAHGASKVPSGFEPLFSENADPERVVTEQPAPDVPELNPFLARVFERVKQSERERARWTCQRAWPAVFVKRRRARRKTGIPSTSAPTNAPHRASS